MCTIVFQVVFEIMLYLYTCIVYHGTYTYTYHGTRTMVPWYRTYIIGTMVHVLYTCTNNWIT
jgi:hypothetical protein